MFVYDYSTEQLLRMAMNMLHVAKEEHQASKRKNKWLVNNHTLEVIEDRVKELTEKKVI